MNNVGWKRWTAGLVAALAVAVGGCGEGAATDVALEASASALTTPTEVTLPLGQEVMVEGTIVRLVFTRVLEDSRCPVDVVCVWQGNAAVEVGIAAGMGPTAPLHLNSALEPRSATWQGIRLTYLSLQPRPRSDRRTAPRNYTLRVLLEDAEN
ncbi:MAG TPA: hypothetical protein VE173_00750 [Longimicrobiales bacterium]|nr:hypothetical protein [Longimicrobiales bacterium]